MTTPTDLAQVRLLQLVSPALPVGGYAFSHGLEYAIHAGWVDDDASLQQWIAAVLARSIAVVDLPLLERCVNAAMEGDGAALRRWNDEILAWRESAELLQADLAMGNALRKLLPTLIPGFRDGSVGDSISWVTAFALAAVGLDVGRHAARLAYLWNFAENQVTAALKLMALGQTAGQRLLVGLAADMPAQADRARFLADDEIGAGAPALALAASWHENQYSRLFRS